MRDCYGESSATALCHLYNLFIAPCNGDSIRWGLRGPTSKNTYTHKVNAGVLPIFRGHLLTNNDLIIRKHILNLMCNLETSWDIGPAEEIKRAIKERLQPMVEDGLMELTEDGIVVREKGRMFVRNICMAFDLRLIENKPETRIFSMTI